VVILSSYSIHLLTSHAENGQSGDNHMPVVRERNEWQNKG
jgi:hypothetical protein